MSIFSSKACTEKQSCPVDENDHCIAFSDIHGEKSLEDIIEKLIKDYCSKSPNAFWTREKYFVSLPFDPLQKIKPMKASARLMSPSERDFCAS